MKEITNSKKVLLSQVLKDILAQLGDSDYLNVSQTLEIYKRDNIRQITELEKQMNDAYLYNIRRLRNRQPPNTQ